MRNECKQDEPRKKALIIGGLAHFIHDGFTDMLYIFSQSGEPIFR